MKITDRDEMKKQIESKINRTGPLTDSDANELVLDEGRMAEILTSSSPSFHKRKKYQREFPKAII